MAWVGKRRGVGGVREGRWRNQAPPCRAALVAGDTYVRQDLVPFRSERKNGRAGQDRPLAVATRATKLALTFVKPLAIWHKPPSFFLPDGDELTSDHRSQACSFLLSAASFASASAGSAATVYGRKRCHDLMLSHTLSPSGPACLFAAPISRFPSRYNPASRATT